MGGRRVGNVWLTLTRVQTTKKEPPEGGSKVNREASNRAGRSHSHPDKLDDPIHTLESLRAP